MADQLLTPVQAAAYLGVKPQTLAVWRSTGRHGIPFIKMGFAVRYRLSDLDRWVQRHTIAPKADTGGEQ